MNTKPRTDSSQRAGDAGGRAETKPAEALAKSASASSSSTAAGTLEGERGSLALKMLRKHGWVMAGPTEDPYPLCVECGGSGPNPEAIGHTAGCEIARAIAGLPAPSPSPREPARCIGGDYRCSLPPLPGKDHCRGHSPDPDAYPEDGPEGTP